MTAQNPATLTEWLLNIPITWLFAGPNGKIEWGNVWGPTLDNQITLLRTAIKARFPDYAPSDAYPNLGADRNLVQGPSETSGNFLTRVKTIWDDAARAGTWVELLTQLYWGGFGGAIVVQQNGLAYNLSGAPTAGQDPTGLLVITACATLSVALTSNVTPPTGSSAGRSIPAGNPWWQFAELRSANANVSDTDFCNRFAVLFPGPSLPSAFRTVVTATFTASDNVVVTWNNAFADTTYAIEPGPAIVTDGGGPVFLSADATTKTLTGVTIRASAPFTGTATIFACQAGANPLADLHPADLARLQRVIRTWRPNALCVGVYALTQGSMYGWPPSTFSGRAAMGTSSIVRFEGVSGGV
jgi:hypothetical protein